MVNLRDEGWALGAAGLSLVLTAGLLSLTLCRVPVGVCGGADWHAAVFGKLAQQINPWNEVGSGRRVEGVGGVARGPGSYSRPVSPLTQRGDGVLLAQRRYFQDRILSGQKCARPGWGVGHLLPPSQCGNSHSLLQSHAVSSLASAARCRSWWTLPFSCRSLSIAAGRRWAPASR